MLRPLHDKITVRPIVRKLSDILIVNNTESLSMGDVVAIGPEVFEVAVGDRVRYGNGDYLKWPTITEGETVYQVIQEADVVGIEVA